jgi:UDP:flavonoid glycosyltransferase YjiC (YdhE family)
MSAAVSDALQSHHLPGCSIDELFFSPRVLKIIPSIPELDGADPNRPDVRYIGQLLGPVQPAIPGAFQPEPGKRYIFVYLGVGSLSLDSLRQVLPNIFPAESSLHCLVGAQSIQSDEQMGGVRFQRYVPAEAVLPYCDWVICHGGQNTIAQSLLHGVPLIVFPGPVFERRFNAQKVQESGAGWMCERHQFTKDRLDRILVTQSNRAARAADLGARIRSYGGPEAAIQAIAERL